MDFGGMGGMDFSNFGLPGGDASKGFNMDDLNFNDDGDDDNGSCWDTVCVCSFMIRTITYPNFNFKVMESYSLLVWKQELKFIFWNL